MEVHIAGVLCFESMYFNNCVFDYNVIIELMYKVFKLIRNKTFLLLKDTTVLLH